MKKVFGIVLIYLICTANAQIIVPIFIEETSYKISIEDLVVGDHYPGSHIDIDWSGIHVTTREIVCFEGKLGWWEYDRRGDLGWYFAPTGKKCT